MSSTPCLDLPYLAAGQAQKHVTLNESLRMLDALVQISVNSRVVANPPVSPVEGARYLLPNAPTGAWSDKAGDIAAWQDGVWNYYTPKTGWLVFVLDEEILIVRGETAWGGAGSLPASLPRLGINASADETNKLSVSADASLFTHAGAGHQLKLNKANAASTASLLFQSGYSGRAEIGCPGSDAFAIKVSPEGVAWKTAMEVDQSTGATQFPYGIAAGDRMANRNLIRNARFRINQRAVSGTVVLSAGAYGHDGAKAGNAGCSYNFAQVGEEIQLTITDGSLILPVEPSLVMGGIYAFSHSGTALVRIWQGTGNSGSGTYAPAPLLTPLLNGGVQTNVEFTAGTVLRPQLESGAVVTQFERLPDQQELSRSLYYYAAETGILRPAWLVSTIFLTREYYIQYPVPMRVAPTVLINWNGGTGGGLFSPTRIGVSAWRTMGNTTSSLYLSSYTASAEI